MRILAATAFIFVSLPFPAFADPPPAESIDDLQTKAEQGDLQAQLRLGAMYNAGSGVPLDYAEAVKWFQKAAEQDDPTAEISLGRAYENGIGLPTDETKAVALYRKAAEHANAEALYSLGRMYLKHSGVNRNDVLAYMLFNLASANGYGAAGQARDKVGEKLTPEQLKAAQGLSSGWRHDTPLPQTTSPELMAPQDLFADSYVNKPTDPPEVFATSKVLVSGEIEINSNKVYVVIMQTKGDECHPCGGNISAATYQKYDDHWGQPGTSINFTQIGGWGNAFEQESATIRFTEVRNMLGGIIFIDDLYGGMGGHGFTYEVVLRYREGQAWTNIGSIETGESNSGDCGPDSLLKIGCFSWTGVIEQRLEKNSVWPVLIVKATGTEANEHGAVVRARDTNIALMAANMSRWSKMRPSRAGCQGYIIDRNASAPSALWDATFLFAAA